MELRAQGKSDEPVLEMARHLPSISLTKRQQRQQIALAQYFLGRQLLENRDPRAFSYLVAAVKADPLGWRSLIGLALGVVTLGGIFKGSSSGAAR